MPDEKYVSIPFSVWENKYKPMEEENERMRDKLKGGAIKIAIYLIGTRAGYSSEREIGHIDYIIGATWPPNRIEWDERSKLQGEVSNAINMAIVNTPRMQYYLSKESAERMLQEINNAAAKVDLLRELNRSNIASIPKLIKWLFKIKA